MKINPLFYIILAVAVLAGLFFVFKPKTTPIADNKPSPSPQLSPTKSFDLMIKDKKIISGPTTISVIQGQEVNLKIISDENEELHVHAYDKSIQLIANQMATLTFTANTSGRFPFELEMSQTELGVLEVQPK